MRRIVRITLVFLGVLTSAVAFAQSGGIYGRVTNEKGEGEFGVIVEVRQGGIVKGGAQTDPDGNYIVKPLDPGQYDVMISLINYDKEHITGVVVTVNNDTKLDKKLTKSSGKTLTEVVVKTSRYAKPLLDDKQVLTDQDIKNMPTRNTADMVSLSAGTYQRKQGAGVNFAGGRSDANIYIVDGVIRRGNGAINMPQNTIAQIQVFNSGLPAMYGDATGGVVAITTKGVARNYTGGLMYERSVEGFGHNLLSMNLSGPFASKKTDVGKKPIAGFLLGVDLFYDKDNDPSYIGNYYLKEDKMRELEQNPLVQIQTSTGSVINQYASEFVTNSDLEYDKTRRNAVSKGTRVNGKLDFALGDNATVTLGGTLNYSDIQNYQRSYSMFAVDQMPRTTDYTAGGYIRFTQRFGNARGDSSIISNAFYTIQADYQKEKSRSEHPVHGRNVFDYNYYGKYDQQYMPYYQSGNDDSTGLRGVRLITYYFPTQVNFTPSELNPVGARYTEMFYDFLGDTRPQNLFDIRTGRGLLNGDIPANVYGIYQNTGFNFNGYNYSDNDQYAVKIDASFDLTPKSSSSRHAIQFGLYYQQRVDRSYALNTLSSGTFNSLWNLMRLNTNTHLGLGTTPYFIVNGQEYTYQDIVNGVVSPSPTDTIIYKMETVGLQSNFDRNLRTKLGLNPNGTDLLNIDNMDPSTFSLDMFSADELLNSGNPFVNYQGFSYTGEKMSGQVSFNDFWTKKDANGNYTREIAAFRPNYIAGYIQDNFRFKDIEFRLGVRVDRYDANTKVLKDPYSLYETVKIGSSDSTAKLNVLNGGKHPSNMGKDYVIYVNSNESSSPTIIGYRSGDDWYDPYGNLVLNPEDLKEYSSGTDPIPYLTPAGKNNLINDSSYYVDGAFTDYKPQVNVAPRVAFRFPIAESSLFYAHYDVLVRRPTTGAYSTPNDYFFLAQNSGTRIGNSDLKPEKMFDYEFGFQQAITRNTAVTITAFYKERKDQIQVRPYLYAYPVTYYTYGNRDFSTTKGLTFKYDFRRQNNLQFELNYTLQFADGSGSSATSAAGGFLQNLIGAGLPNLRITPALSYDSRHIINAIVDYRYAQGEGPKINDKPIFQNMGVNLIFRGRSGEPYTRYAIANTNVVQGTVMGSRLPWHFLFDLKLDKDFTLNIGKAKEGVERRPLYLNAFVLIRNLFNRKDILGVYGYTSRPDDDGYVTSPQGQQVINGLYSPQSYMDLYLINVNNPGNYNTPRQINLGLSLNF